VGARPYAADHRVPSPVLSAQGGPWALPHADSNFVSKLIEIRISWHPLVLSIPRGQGCPPQNPLVWGQRQLSNTVERKQTLNPLTVF